MTAEPCHQLWCAVLHLAVDEALRGPSKVNGASSAETAQDARDYILEAGPDFRLVCSLAGLNPDAVREAFVKRLAEREAGVEARPRRSPRASAGHARQRRGRPPATYTHDGRTMTVAAWAKEAGLPHATLHSRLRSGWPIARALAEPLRGTGQPGPTPDTGQAKAERAQALADMEAFEPELILDAEAQAAGGARHRGVDHDFGALEGTGGGPTEQETPEIAFAEAQP